MSWDDDDIKSFVVEKTKERWERAIEGPAWLGDYTVWRCWTYDGKEFHAHYVIAREGKPNLELKRDFPPFAHWLTLAFNEADAHERRLDWLRSGVATLIVLTLLVLTVAKVGVGVEKVDFGALVAGLSATAAAYLLGPWTRTFAQRRRERVSAAPSPGATP